ncbi:hypothetical protein AOL_s00215g396 [Orbilia oligospora ATCC 24927]|uniref:General negative regulator of transcription subunit 1 n=1 Tax=Arthrobotrys oligospora (strain ATCC 24927 / CBS 115.81 / DSM 1491) TaxID=756982 RepID=G1XSP8_ARTOA|nr:hypothetical protein AOL_s00215g396 [Orbilia oligospora ATCC 24927]EGX43660.1 hypothetical protein AOL_s00215g396 [Orbilia oligospora ATCC 24927]
MKEDKYESQANQIRQLCEQNGMEVYTKLIRRLITGNAPTIFPNINRQIENPHNYKLLVEEVHKASESTNSAKDIAEAIAGNDTDLFKDFDLAGFMRHFNLDALGRSVFALGFKNSPKADLRNKAHDIITNAFGAMLEILGNSAKHENWDPALIAQYLTDYLSEPLPSFFDLNAKLNLSYAARVRFSSSTIPEEIQVVTDSVEKLRGQESLRRLFTMAGSNSTNSLDACREVLKRKWKVELSEEEVAEMLITMATGLHPTDWNPEVFVKAILENNIGPAFDWNLLIDVLDKPEFIIEDPDGLSLLIKGLLVATQKNPDLEISRLWSGRKNNPRSQLSIMKALLSRRFESFNLAKVPNLQKIVSINDQFQDAPAKLSALATTYENQKLNSLGAVQSLLYLAVDRSVPKDVKTEAGALVERQWKLVPELLLVGAFIADKPWAQEHEGIVKRLFSSFFEGSPSRQLVFYLLWSYDRLGVMERFIEIYRGDKLKVTRILEIAKEIQILWDLTKSIAYYELALDIACLAAVSDALNLEKWLTEMFAENGKDFISETLIFLETRSIADYEFQPSETEKQKSQVNLHAAEVSQILEACEQSEHSALATAEQREFMVSVQRKCIQSYPRLINLRQGHDHIILSANRNKNTFSPDVDKKMQDYYQKMYSGEITITTMVKDLQHLKKSDTVQDQDLFACMIHSLFDEYTCYPSYPIEPLATTSVLFGSLIEYHLLEGLALNVALGMVLDAVKKHPPRDNMYKFGLQALKHFQTRLQEWRGFCQHLTTIPGLHDTDIMEIAMRVVSSGDGQNTLSEPEPEPERIAFPAPGLTNGAVEPTLTPQPAVEFRALRLDRSPQDEDSYEEPVERVRDKVLFIVNNLTASNLDVKLKELQSTLNEKSYRWFADYLVVQRARLEPNNHKLYIDFIEGLGSRILHAEVLHETYRNAFNLLNNENTALLINERTHLKHLAIWLGSMTLAKDKPIKHKIIGFKEFLIEAYDTQRLLIALPFTCKVLEQAARSTIFRPPNPWTMAILRLLAELYRFAELKLNLKFEIEVLCKALGTDIKNVEASTDLRDRPPLQEESDTLVDGLADFGGLMFPRDDRADRFSENAINSLLPDLHNQIVINTTLNGFGQHPKVRSILTAAIERAIREIMSPVVERSVTIAAISTSQLILKDFATEPNEEKMRKAAHSMVQTMAGSLALVTCKEPLRMSMSNHIRQLLASNGYPEQTFADQAILVIVNDNLELASAVIERAAQEKAMPEIDDNLQQAYAVRRLHRERGRQNGGQPFTDPAISRYMVSLPEPFRLKPGGLSPTQLNVYDDFSRMPRASSEVIATARMSQEVISDFAPIGQPSEGPSPVPLTHQNLALAQQQQQPQQRQALLPPPSIVSRPAQSPGEMFKSTRDRMFELLNEIGVVLKEVAADSLADVPESSHLKALMNDFVRIAAGSPFMDNLCLTLASYLYKILYERAETAVEAETFVFLLEKLCQLSQNTAQEVMATLVSPENEQLFNLPFTNLLIRSRLITLSMLDVTIARAIEGRKPGAIEFLSGLIREIVLGPDPVALRSDFAGSLDKLFHFVQQDPQNTVGRSLLQELQKFEMPPAPPEEEQPPEEVTIRDQLAYIFEEWVQLCDHPTTTEKNFAAFISQLYNEKTLEDQSTSALFFRTCVETAIEHHEKEITTAEDPTFNSVYNQVDSLAKLIVLLAKYHLETEGESANKAEYLKAIFSVIILVFNHQHEVMNGAVFNQKVFYRLFSSLLCEWHEVEGQLGEYQRPIMLAFYDLIMALQPVYYPAFAFAWASLVAHRLFVPKMIALTDDDGWNLYERVLERLLRYLGGLVKSPELIDEILHFYRGILRFLLVLHHDFPDFLAEYHNSICASIPTNCTQLRNLILSAFPIGSKELPDPFTHGLKVDRLPEIRKPPKIALPHTFGERLAQLEIREAVDRCLNEGPKEADIALIASKMTLKSPGFDKVNVDDFSLNSLVIYVVMHAISVGEKRNTAAFIPHSPHTTFLFELAQVFNPEARYFFLGAMANQLRYPNSHTHFFSCTLLSLFGHVKGTPHELDIRQQITRVLLERLIVHRPHPWGLIITLLELLKNPSYEFWNLSFIKAAPEVNINPEIPKTKNITNSEQIEKLFDALFAHVNHSPQL